MNRYFILSLLLICFSFPLMAQEIKQDTLPKYSYASIRDFSEQLDDIFEDQNFSSANWGVVIQSLSNGEYFYKRNEDKLFMPASNLKLFTTATALNVLGKDYRFKTEIYTLGTLDGSTLKGDLIIKGYGDPSISGRFHNDDITKVFSNWADSLLEHGIDEISGQIIGDDNAFDELGLGEGWAWESESQWYAAPSAALALNDNCVDLIVHPTTSGQRAVVEFAPYNRYTTVINKVITTPKDSLSSIKVFRERGTNIITVVGSVKENAPVQKFYATVNNPTQYFVVVLKDVLQKKGIKVGGFGIDIDDLTEPVDYSRAKKLFTSYSPPLSLLVRVINKNSQNFFAEQLLKVMGYEKERYGSAANGLKVVHRFLETIGINTDNFAMVDGSGLSRLNLISPKQFVNLLSYMERSELFDYFYSSLPIAGIDGTLADRLQKTKAENNLRGKTGFLEGVRSLCGYIYTGDKELVAFCMIVNNFTAPLKLAENLQDLVCIRLANFRRK